MLAELAIVLRERLAAGRQTGDLPADQATCHNAATAAGDLPADDPMTAPAAAGDFLAAVGEEVTAAGLPRTT